MKYGKGMNGAQRSCKIREDRRELRRSTKKKDSEVKQYFELGGHGERVIVGLSLLLYATTAVCCCCMLLKNAKERSWRNASVLQPHQTCFNI
jgi:hypothetical protein